LRTIVLICGFLLLSSCSSESVEDIEVLSNLVEIEFITKEPNFDKIEVTYLIEKSKPYAEETYTFSYDSNGDPLPLKITLNNYPLKLIDGEGFRENHSPAELSVKLYVNSQLIMEDTSKGTAETYATVNFKYTIPD
jgi:hypothetical protein